jgi:hypothetical protein
MDLGIAESQFLAQPVPVDSNHCFVTMIEPARWGSRSPAASGLLGDISCAGMFRFLAWPWLLA